MTSALLGKIRHKTIHANIWNKGPKIKIKNSLPIDKLKPVENLEIPPKGYIKILNTVPPKRRTNRTCPISWTTIKKVITTNEKKEAVSTETNAIK